MESKYHMNYRCNKCWYMYPTNKELTNGDGCRCHTINYCNAWCKNCKYDCKITSCSIATKYKWCEKFELKDCPTIDVKKDFLALELQNKNGLISDEEYNNATAVTGDYKPANIMGRKPTYKIELEIDYKDDRFAQFMADFTKLLQAYHKK